MSMRRPVRFSILTVSVWCCLGSVLAPPAVAVTRSLAPALAPGTCPGTPQVRHAAAGIDFGGKESTADPDGTRGAIARALRESGLLPSGWSVDAAGRVTRGDFAIDVEPVSVRSGLSYAPVATARFTGADSAVVQVSDRARADFVRLAVAAKLAELDRIVTEREAKARRDVTSALVEGLLTTKNMRTKPPGTEPVPLSPRDLGKVKALGLLTGSSDAKLDALGAAVAMGLLDPDPASPPHLFPGNEPLAGRAASAARADTVRGLLPTGSLDGLLDGASQEDLQQLRAVRGCQRDTLRDSATGVIAARARADKALTDKLDAARTLPVVNRVIVGGGWAATVDYLTLNPPAAPGGKVPPVLAVAAGPGMVTNLGDFRLTQPPMDMELPGAPFQPTDFARDPVDFSYSTDFGKAVGTAAALAGMPTYRTAITKVEQRGDAKWPDGAAYRLTLSSGRLLYARTVDVATGLGPARIPDAPRKLTDRTFFDPQTHYRLVFDHDGAPTVLDRDGNRVTDGLPDQVGWLFGVKLENGRPVRLPDRSPFLLDRSGRPTDPCVVDPQSGVCVDQDTRLLFDQDGRQVDRDTVDPDTLSRLGFTPDGGFRSPGSIADPDTGYSVNPITGEIIRTATGEPVTPDLLPAETAEQLAALIRRHRVNYGGDNTSASYDPGDRVLVVGGGAGGASEVEQATGGRRQVTWGAKDRPLAASESDVPQGPKDGLDPRGLWRIAKDPADPRQEQAKVDLSFLGDGFNRRNTLPGVGAFSLEVWEPVTRTNDLPTRIRYTVLDQFQTTGTDPADRALYDRIVYTIGQEAADPGGAAALLSGVSLFPIPDQPGGELNGLTDADRGLRVLGAAGVTRSVLALTSPDGVDSLLAQIREQGRALPPDARGITPSIRYHARRIAELNRTTGAVMSRQM
ncbi:hypothetical protein GCM10010193_28390 [Kitasatospora atroaurantiaca]|uniref:Peptidoglycan binding protein n=1 Tax=Kitasatospora atroaurantiaca TaxID=285545 RepID=A0A561EJ13_9ACTN|nr:hypothetical protein [Kitasatospora atroaurantiaca]TWE15598.1 hypothetical protein FB465_0509 [Kitasatospora atroaurantiaca]